MWIKLNLVTFFVITFLSQAGCCHTFTIEPKFWKYKGHPIAYEVAHDINSANLSDDAQNNEMINRNQLEPIVVLNGFGVGSFHQHRLIPQLVSHKGEQSNDDAGSYRFVYGMDYLGQGRSWPEACEDGEAECERGLVYSADTWIDQIISFIEEIVLPNHKKIPEEDNPVKVHLVGNSVGGYLSAVLALKRPDLINSITLLNATPVWGLNLPGWSGHLPAPIAPKKIGRYLFDIIRDLNTIEKYLETAYSNRSAFGDDLMKQIRGCTNGPGGHAAFASIMWSPPASLPEGTSDFNSILQQLKCDVLLIFGKDDPWCTPAFAKRMLNSLGKRVSSIGNSATDNQVAHRYVELSNVGHCPNHEAPQAVAKLVTKWVSTKDRDREKLVLVEGQSNCNGVDIVQEPWGTITMREVDLDETEELNPLDSLLTSIIG